MFDLFYRKNNNKSLFSYLEKNGFSNVQNYIPLYSNFFDIDKNNFNSINLNNRWAISGISKRVDNNNFNITITDNSGNSGKCDSFFKFSPLLDPVKYMVGKYNHMESTELCALPSFEDNNSSALEFSASELNKSGASESTPNSFKSFETSSSMFSSALAPSTMAACFCFYILSILFSFLESLAPWAPSALWSCVGGQTCP